VEHDIALLLYVDVCCRRLFRRRQTVRSQVDIFHLWASPSLATGEQCTH